MQTGVPQVTILGPLLFILYVNELLLDVHQNIILSYAQDTAWSRTSTDSRTGTCSAACIRAALLVTLRRECVVTECVRLRVTSVREWAATACSGCTRLCARPSSLYCGSAAARGNEQRVSAVIELSWPQRQT